MRVLLVRHGQAVDGSSELPDSDRFLTAKGRHVTRDVARVLAEHDVKPTRIVTSPLVRAVQTAEIIAESHAFDGTITVWRALAPDGTSVLKALRPLDDATEQDTVALVGHEPLMRAMAAQLLGLSMFPGFKKSAVCLIKRKAGGTGAFRWMLVPRNMTLIDTLDDLERRIAQRLAPMRRATPSDAPTAAELAPANAFAAA